MMDANLWRRSRRQYPRRELRRPDNTAPCGAAPLARFATSVGLRPLCVTHPTTFSHPDRRAPRILIAAQHERGRKLLAQLELQLEELEASATEDEVTAGSTAQDATSVRSVTRKKPVRAPLPAHLPRERVVVPAPPFCPCCGGKLVKLGEDVTETLEVVPRQWKAIQTVREKFSCRSCEKITQPPAPFHVIARARAGVSLLAMIVYAKLSLCRLPRSAALTATWIPSRMPGSPDGERAYTPSQDSSVRFVPLDNQPGSGGGLDPPSTGAASFVRRTAPRGVGHG
jgi:hypothetical protein